MRAGERVLFFRKDGIGVFERNGARRRFGVRTERLERFVTDGTNVLWSANGCLLLAPITDPATRAPGPGPCARSEAARLRRASKAAPRGSRSGASPLPPAPGHVLEVADRVRCVVPSVKRAVTVIGRRSRYTRNADPVRARVEGPTALPTTRPA